MVVVKVNEREEAIQDGSFFSTSIHLWILLTFFVEIIIEQLK